jgi:hypothetical protein
MSLVRLGTAAKRFLALRGHKGLPDVCLPVVRSTARVLLVLLRYYLLSYIKQKEGTAQEMVKSMVYVYI